MLVFIDDSGDTGFKLGKGSSRYFVLSCVIFDDELEAEKCSVAIKQLKRDLRFPDSVEFKFNKSRKRIRETFLNTVAQYKFTCRSLVVDKTLLYGPELTHNKNSFYAYFIKTLLKNNNQTISNAKIRIDGGGSREFKRNFILYLRRELNSQHTSVMKKCQIVDSKSNTLIQLADMVAGSIHCSYEDGRTDKGIYRDIISKHIQDEWQFK